MYACAKWQHLIYVFIRWIVVKSLTFRGKSMNFWVKCMEKNEKICNWCKKFSSLPPPPSSKIIPPTPGGGGNYYYLLFWKIAQDPLLFHEDPYKNGSGSRSDIWFGSKRFFLYSPSWVRIRGFAYVYWSGWIN